MVRRIETQNEYLGKEENFNIAEIGLGPQDSEVIERVEKLDDVALHAFMHEPVTVMLADSNDPLAEDPVQIIVNGNSQLLKRGAVQTIKRYFVERLARAKPTSYSQNLDERLGEQSYNTMRPRHALRCPFTVIEDKNPRGAAWLRQILAERT